MPGDYSLFKDVQSLQRSKVGDSLVQHLTHTNDGAHACAATDSTVTDECTARSMKSKHDEHMGMCHLNRTHSPLQAFHPT